MEGAKYGRILDENLLESVMNLKLSRRFTFQQDNDPEHKVKAILEWLNKKKIIILEWRSQSPDLNPIEHLWRDLKIAVHRRSPSNLAELEQFSHEEWAKISPSHCVKVVETYPKGLIPVIAAKGYTSPYWMVVGSRRELICPLPGDVFCAGKVSQSPSPLVKPVISVSLVVDNPTLWQIQKIWRGYYIRNYVHNYYARKSYLETLVVTNQITRIQLKEIVDSQAREQDQRFRESEERRMDRLACRTHYLVSTRHIPGIYNSPFFKEPMAMERRLIEARPPINAKRSLIPARNSTPGRSALSFQKPCSMLHIAAKKPQGPFREQSHVWRQRLKPLEPTLRVATSFTSAEEAALEQRREEWRTRVIDDAFLPFANHRKNKKYEPLLQTSCTFGPIDDGTHHFRDTEPSKNISKKVISSDRHHRRSNKLPLPPPS
uniref:spermatogenesis-associated protein 17 n=1 Tax=Myxine glutinosa TaxID=7769 RepID=UPI00358F2196